MEKEEIEKALADLYNELQEYHRQHLNLEELIYDCQSDIEYYQDLLKEITE